MSNYLKSIWFIIIVILFAIGIFLVSLFHSNVPANSNIVSQQQADTTTSIRTHKSNNKNNSTSDPDIINSKKLSDRPVSYDDLLNMSDAEREQILDKMHSEADRLSSQELVSTFLKATIQEDALSDQLITEKLIMRARDQHDPDVVQSILDIFPELPEDQQYYLIDILGPIANIDSLNGLLDIASDSLSPKIKNSALYEVSRIGMHVTDNESRQTLTNTLMATYNNNKANTDIQNACVSGIKSLNTTSGKTFLQTIQIN